MSDDEQGSATATNADVMGEMLQGSDVASTEAAARQYSVGDASMIAQAGDAAQLADKGDNPFSGSQNTSFSDQANLETPNAKPEHVDSKESPQKSSSDLSTARASQGHAKQDLNGKLDDAAPENTSQSDDKASGQHPQQEASTVATPAGKEASNVNLTLDTPSSDLANGSQPTSDSADGTISKQQADTAPDAANAEAVSVKQLIQWRSSGAANGPSSQQSSPPPVRRRTEDELPEGIRALKNRFSAASPATSSPSPQPILLPKDVNPKAPPPLHFEVEYKPGSKFWPYKELKDLRIENGIDPTCKEEYLTEDDFSEVFKKWDINRTQFKAQPIWRQRMQKQTVGLF